MVPDATNLINCAISGPGRILGIESGSAVSHEDYRALSRRAHDGRILIYVQSRPAAGEAVINVSSAGLEAASVTVKIAN